MRSDLGSNICLWRAKTTSNFIGVLEQMGNSPERGGLEHGLEHRLVDDRRESYSVAQSCLILCDSKDCSMPGFPVLEFVQTHAH